MKPNHTNMIHRTNTKTEQPHNRTGTEQATHTTTFLCLWIHQM